MAESASQEEVVAADMELEETNPPKGSASADDDGAAASKRAREEAGDDDGEASKKQKVAEKSVEEQRLEKTEEENGSEAPQSGPVKVGPKEFGSSVELFDYFYKLLHSWTPNLNINEYEHMMLMGLLKKGHLEAERKIGKGIRAFQVRFHPQFKSRCFFLIREDDTSDDFSFRKCVDHILPLPENMQIKHDVNKALGGKGGGGRGGGGRGRGRGRGGKPRH